MIQLTRLNDSKLWVASEQIEFMESTPDTVLTLINGTKIIVLEKPVQILEKMIEYRRRIHQRELTVENLGKRIEGVRSDGD